MKSQFEINKILSQWITKQLSNRFEGHLPLPSIEIKSSCIISKHSEKNTGLFGNFSQYGGEADPIPKTGSKNTTYTFPSPKK